MIPSHEIKRQILMHADESMFKKPEKEDIGLTDGEIIEMGNELEKVTKLAGWSIIEQYMLNTMNPVELVNASERDKGTASGFIKLMQWIHLAIQRKDKLKEKKNETQTVPEDQADHRV